MKNKEIAVRVGTTEQVVKNYLRKVYDKLGVADRLELALFCLNNRVLETPCQAAHRGPSFARQWRRSRHAAGQRRNSRKSLLKPQALRT